jgi:signal transduction histidine kinase/CheY-like chemotaxis protein
MQRRGQTVGVLHVHMEEGVEVDQRERDLLLEVAQDLAFARQKILADEALRDREAELEEINRRLHDALAELRSTEEHLIEQERHRAFTQMASGIAHDFNNSLSTVLGFSELLIESPEKRRDDERALRYLELVHKAATHASQTVGRMRKFYRPREEELFDPLDLNALVEQAISMTRPRWEEQMQAQGATIRVEMDLGEVGEVESNEAELHEMLTNLIFNAVDAMPEGGRLSLSTYPADGQVVLEVADTGVGMSPEELEHCMEPFFSTKEETGSGLGLSAARGILERHDGEITVRSRPGQGATFRITLPRAEPAVTERNDKTQDAPETTPMQIMVVENEEHQREMLTQYVLTAGHSVETAADGKEGLRKFARHSYDVVITDRAMPEMRGDEVAAAVKKQAPQTAVIMVTGFGQMMEVANERVAHVDLVLSKPITLAELRKALAQVSG